MTILKKRVRRETEEYNRHRPLIIQIDPADSVHNLPTMIKIKEKGRRLWYEIPLNAVFVEAAKRYAAKQIKERLKERARKGDFSCSK